MYTFQIKTEWLNIFNISFTFLSQSFINNNTFIFLEFIHN